MSVPVPDPPLVFSQDGAGGVIDATDRKGTGSRNQDGVPDACPIAGDLTCVKRRDVSFVAPGLPSTGAELLALTWPEA